MNDGIDRPIEFAGFFSGVDMLDIACNRGSSIWARGRVCVPPPRTPFLFRFHISLISREGGPNKHRGGEGGQRGN